MILLNSFILPAIGFIAFGMPPIDAHVEKIINESNQRNGYELSDLYRLLFTTVKEDGLSQLLVSDNHSVAVQSAWEVVAVTIPIQQTEKTYRPDQTKLHWFLGFVEGRARVSIPKWWRDILLDARANHRSNIYPGEPERVPYYHASLDYVSCPKTACVEKKGGFVIYRTGEVEFKIPSDLLEADVDDDGNYYGNVSGLFTDKNFFLAIHNDIGSPYDVCCFDRSSSRLVWKSRACGCFFGGGASGVHESWVAIVPAINDRVFVFGSAATGFYFHGFRVSDGQSIMRFSTSY